MRPRVGAVVALLLPVTAAADLVFVGEARTIDGKQLLYRELHHVTAPGTARERQVVLYQCPDSAAIFARKELDFSRTRREAPLFELIDARLGYTEGVRMLPGGRLQVFTKPGAKYAERNALLPAGKAIVMDAGFDEFVRMRWAELEARRSVKFSFLVPSRMHAIDFRISRHHDIDIAGEPAAVIRLNLSGFLGWFLPYIDVAYRKSDRLLLRYTGLSNMRDLAGDNLNVRIDFPPALRRAQPVDLEQLRAVPLLNRCP
ncbi:MAG: hypothetical protein RML32_02385 [Gammaproteobacteria bacterium]|nr:hypothetical protein [Gammaproteobacteria bacterium]